jgi:hypothetical protein
MSEKEFVKNIANIIAPLISDQGRYKVDVEFKLAYSFEAKRYDGEKISSPEQIQYETDLIVREFVDPIANQWIPRVVVEAKVFSITTHAAITYSQKAHTHKTVHPYLRYGIMLGRREHYPLPGRLFRHGSYFDFMISFVEELPSQEEIDLFVSLIKDEIRASQDLEKMIYDSRKRALVF